MRYYVDRTCTDFNGQFFVEGTEVELSEGKHNAHLIPMIPVDEPETEAVVAETEPEAETPAEDSAPKKTSRKKAAASKAEG